MRKVFESRSDNVEILRAIDCANPDLAACFFLIAFLFRVIYDIVKVSSGSIRICRDNLTFG